MGKANFTRAIEKYFQFRIIIYSYLYIFLHFLCAHRRVKSMTELEEKKNISPVIQISIAKISMHGCYVFLR